MSAAQDHSDIDKLPTEFEVHEAIREVFLDPQNGTQDDISRAGCLALAKKSNEVGGKDNGHVVWNAWRKSFPTTPNPSKNRVQFAGVNFSTSENKLNDQPISFAKFEFGDWAEFKGSEWDGFTNFEGAKFGGNACFLSARFGSNANFSCVVFGPKADFRSVAWGLSANFQGTYWMQDATFSGAQFGGLAMFNYALFEDGANFEGTEWHSLSHPKWLSYKSMTNFQGVVFVGQVSFQGARFDCDMNFSGASPKVHLGTLTLTKRAQLATFIEDNDLSTKTFHRIDFSGAEFLGNVNFENRCFLSKTSFGCLDQEIALQSLERDQEGKLISYGEMRWRLSVYKSLPKGKATTFAQVPEFHGCEFNQDTSFEGAKFPQPTGSEEAARAYRTLKLAFSKQQAIREEQRFFRLEMEEETLRETGLKRVLFKAYKFCSDYGFSVVRPLVYGGVLVLALTALYGFLSWLGQCGVSLQACHFAPQWLEFSLLQTLPLPGLDKLVEDASKVFWPSGAWWGLALSVLVVFHKTISLAVLFLVGLAIRNLFKLK